MSNAEDWISFDGEGYSPSRWELSTRNEQCQKCGSKLHTGYPRSGVAFFCPDCDVIVYSR